MKRTLEALIGAAIVGVTVFAGSCEVEEAASTADATETAQRRLDRMGRVEVTNFMLCFRPYCDDDSIKDTYNHDDPFALDPQHVDRYREALQEGLARLDGFDDGVFSNVEDWPSPHPLLGMLLTDHLIVDVTRTCTVDSESYLEIEMAAFRGEAHETCGGRTPNADVIDTTLTLLINGPDRAEPHRGDGVNEPSEPATDTFPYFAPPH